MSTEWSATPVKIYHTIRCSPYETPGTSSICKLLLEVSIFQQWDLETVLLEDSNLLHQRVSIPGDSSLDLGAYQPPRS